MRFKGKTVAVTGAASGIGKAIAMGFAKEGADVVFMDINLESANESATEAINSYKTNCMGVSVDVSNKQSVENAFNKLEETYSKLDIFVNCAGISIIVPMLECTEEIWDKTIDINLKGTFLCMQSAIKIMDKQKSGSIICMSSQSGKVGGGQYQAYCASKFGVIGIVQSAAVEFAKNGIRINAICPGVIYTPMWDKQIHSYAKKRNIKSEEVMPYFASKIPMGRIGTTEEVVNVTFFLASDDSAYLTGQSLNVCGGQVMF
jgi:sorbitol-6-phosphate 2-dehydrogenase